MIFLRSTDQVSTWREERYDPALFQYHLSTAEKRDIWRPGKTEAGTRDNEAKIRDVPGNTERLATMLYLHMTSFCSSRIATLFALIA